jgi:alanine racemase
MHNTARAEVDLDAVRSNLKVVRAICPRSRILAMVKADAYGHGLLQVAQALEAADGFAVARLQEALRLRNNGIQQRVLLLGTLLDEQDLACCSDQNIDVTVHDRDSVEAVLSQARRKPFRIWLKLDSGMHRMGLSPDAFLEADRMLATHSGIVELTHMTHFSSADDPQGNALERQLSCFWACHGANPNAKASLANSAALLSRPETRTDWVRPGIMLYGDNPLAGRIQLSLRPAMTLRARVIAIRHIGAGETVGYNGRWMSKRPSRIGTIGIGYGDGYPRHARNGTPVWIDGKLVPIAGQISMDTLTLDLTEHPGVRVGDEAVLWGPQLPAATIAGCAGTISYDLFTSLSSRVTRECTAEAAPDTLKRPDAQRASIGASSRL